jgi:trimethylamine---corrinoid protein Co-methyltransferase
MICSILTQDHIRKIHEVSLGILERVGVEVPHPEILRRFSDSGARVDFNTGRVRIPPALVMRSIEQAGKQFTLYGRDLSRKAAYGLGTRNYNSVAGEALWLENVGKQRRYATIADVVTAVRFGDALPHINLVGAMADPHDLPVSYRCVEVMAVMLKYTTKPIHFWLHDRASTRYLIEMMVALRGDEDRAERFPVFYPFLEPVSPLRYPFDGIDLLFETARLNLPVPIGPIVQMGVSGPATRAGTMAQENAEILAGVCVTQLIRPGMPVMYGGIPHAFDMATTQIIGCGPEEAIFGVAMTQMGKQYGFPVYINVGITDSKRPDAQAGLEIGATLMCGAAAGADIFGHMGMSGVDQAASLDILILQHEAISYVESALREIEFTDETFAIEDIEAVANGGKTFLDREHTVRHFRQELWFPALLNRNNYQDWIEGGALSTEDRCRQSKEHILRTHQPEPIPPELERALADVVEAARRDLAPL